MSSAGGEAHSDGALHFDGDRRWAALVEPSGEVHPDPVALHARGAMMRSEAQAAHALGAVNLTAAEGQARDGAEDVPYGALLQGEASSFACNGEQEVNPGEGSRKYSSVWGDDVAGLGHHRSQLDSPQAWSAKKNEKMEWMQIDLGSVKLIGGVVTQGRNGYDQWVSRIEPLISKDGADFWGLGGVMGANGDQSTKQFNRISQPKEGQFVRIMVKDWFSHISMRAAVLTCKATTTTTTTTTSTTTTAKKLVKSGASSRGASWAGAALAAVMAWWVAEQP
jgi:hypothetical protein